MNILRGVQEKVMKAHLNFNILKLLISFVLIINFISAADSKPICIDCTLPVNPIINGGAIIDHNGYEYSQSGNHEKK